MDCVNHPGEEAIFQCYRCQSPICVDCETKIDGHPICPACVVQIRERLAERYQAETRHVNYGAAVSAGLLAAAAVAFGWSQLAVMTGYRMGPGALLLGGAVGYAVLVGAGEKRGHSLQQIASVTALVGILFAYLLIFLRAQGDVYAFPEHLTTLSVLDWLLLALGVACAYWVPHIRSLPKQP